MTEFPQLGGFDRPAVTPTTAWSFYLIAGLVLAVLVGAYFFFKEKKKAPAPKKPEDQPLINLADNNLRLA